MPSVSVGLGLLVAFSRPPVLLNGTTLIVLIAHLVLMSAFTYGNVSAGLARLPADFEQVAESLGARPFYRLCRVTLPLVDALRSSPRRPELRAVDGRARRDDHGVSAGLGDACPIGIFALSDRGAMFDAAALTMVLRAVTLTSWWS